MMSCSHSMSTWCQECGPKMNSRLLQMNKRLLSEREKLRAELAVALEKVKRFTIIIAEGVEHKRLADAADELIEAMDPKAWGDMPNTLRRLAKQVREGKE